MKILAFGGSFDPPHLGHARMLAAALKRLRPDRAYALPAFRSPLKAPARAPGRERAALLRLALREGLPRRWRGRVVVDDFELRRGRVGYTYQALRRLRRRHPGAELWFLAGSDALADFPRWKRPRELMRLCRWAVGMRKGGPPLRAGPGMPKLLRLPGSFPDISSTKLRCLILGGADVSRWLSRGVLRRMRRRGLYGLAIHERLSRSLKPERYRHTLCVAKAASDLALRHGLDPERAALAGLLHDAGRSLPLPAMIRYALRRRLPVPLRAEVARRQPILLHAHVSEDRARRELGVRDPGVLGAVRKHTLGGRRMSPLERLLYVADACSEDRRFPGAKRLRRLAREDLGAALREAVALKLRHALEGGRWIHPLGAALWNGLLDEE